MNKSNIIIITDMSPFHVQELTTIAEEKDIEFGATNYDSSNNCHDIDNGGVRPIHDDVGRLQAGNLKALEQKGVLRTFVSGVPVEAGNRSIISGSTDCIKDGDTVKTESTKSTNTDEQYAESDRKVARKSHRPYHLQKQHYRHQSKDRAAKEELRKFVNPDSCKTRKQIGIIVFVVVLVVSVTAACMSFRSKFPGPVAEDSKDFITNMLRQIITDPETLSLMDQEHSPQYKARMWLSHNDFHLQRSNTEHSLRQRFVLAVLFMSTDGENWTTSDNDKRDSIRSSSSASSKSANSMMTSYKQNFGGGDSFSFLNPYSHECSWTGIECTNDGDDISSINLSGRNLNGTVPKEIGLVSHLQQLILNENSLKGTIPETIEELSNLRRIDISQNQMSGTIPSSLWSLSLLRYAYLYDNAFDGQIHNHQSQHQRQHSQLLRDVRLHQNQLTGSIPLWFGQLEQLESLILFDNLLTGSVHDFISSSSANNGLSRLSRLDLSSNMLWGSFPTDIGVRSLSYLDLSSNLIQGTIPSEFFDPQRRYYPSLQYLYLHNNMLTGTLPGGIGHSNIKHLWLNSNKLSGRIPIEFGSQWYRLKELLLHDNQFTGSITVCTGMNNISSAVDSTPISRSFPYFWPAIERLEADCSSFVQCPCCTACHTP